MLEPVILTALSVAGVLFTLKKWGILDWYGTYRKAWMPEASCYFCLSFWLSLVPLTLTGWYVIFGALASAILSAFILSVVVQRED